MAVSTYIITISDFKGREDISENLLTSRLQAKIGKTQERFARSKILCWEFYAEVLAHVDGATTAPITALMPFIKDYLVHKTYAAYLNGANILMTPAGGRISTDTTSEAASRLDMADLIAEAENDANGYQDDLVNFLHLNADDYPTWRDSICGCGDRRVKNNNQFSIVGGNKRKTRIDWT